MLFTIYVPTAKRKKRNEETDNNNYKALYNNAVREIVKKEDILSELKSALLGEQEQLIKIEAEIKERKKVIDGLLRKVKNYG